MYTSIVSLDNGYHSFIQARAKLIVRESRTPIPPLFTSAILWKPN